MTGDSSLAGTVFLEKKAALRGAGDTRARWSRAATSTCDGHVNEKGERWSVPPSLPFELIVSAVAGTTGMPVSIHSPCKCFRAGAVRRLSYPVSRLHYCGLTLIFTVATWTSLVPAAWPVRFAFVSVAHTCTDVLPALQLVGSRAQE